MISTKTSVETLDKITRMLEHGSGMFYLRFGGDFAVMRGHHAGWQPYSPELARELEEAFAIESPEYIRAVPICYPNEPGMELIGLNTVTPPQGPYVEMMNQIERRTEQRTFYNANALSYLSACMPAVLRDFIRSWIAPERKNLFLGSLPKDVVERLFGSIAYHIETPAYGAYNHIDKWWPEVAAKADKASFLLLAAGMSTRVVAKRLWEQGLRGKPVIDLGSWIDAFAGLSTRSWIKTAFENKAFDASALV